MRPAIDIHYRPDSSEESNLTFILQKPRGLDSELNDELVKSYVNDPYFCKYLYMAFLCERALGIDILFG